MSPRVAPVVVQGMVPRVVQGGGAAGGAWGGLSAE